MTETRMLMAASSLAMGIAGLVTSFLPQEILEWTGASVETVPVVIIQITGALYVGFAAMNWMARGVLIGGIYARPLAIGNFGHFAIAGVTLAKLAFARPEAMLIAISVPYIIFALWFARVLFRPPSG